MTESTFMKMLSAQTTPPYALQHITTTPHYITSQYTITFLAFFPGHETHLFMQKYIFTDTKKIDNMTINSMNRFWFDSAATNILTMPNILFIICPEVYTNNTHSPQSTVPFYKCHHFEYFNFA